MKRVMRTEEELRMEIQRLENILAEGGHRTPKYLRTSLTIRIESLRWALGEKTMWDDK